MREINFDEDIHWTSGYSIYRNAEATYRYIYGYSYESDKRNLAGPIKASASYISVSMAAVSVALGLTYLM